jgi:hypothetical protein
MYSSKLFAEKVMPKLRGLLPECEGDERFWCHPLARRAAPGSLPEPLDPAPAPGQVPRPARVVEPA